VEEIAEDLAEQGLQPKREHWVATPGGEKRGRFVDVAGIDPKTKEVKELHQVGRATKGGEPVSRERKALADIAEALKMMPKFHPYNTPK
jgi:hypothetical protein